MSALTLQARIARHREHAKATRHLDEELGTLHGIGWPEFVLLDAIESAAGSAAAADVAGQLGLSSSRLLLQVLPMEKLGLVRRKTLPAGKRSIELLAAGRRLLTETRETAAAICLFPPAEDVRAREDATPQR